MTTKNTKSNVSNKSDNVTREIVMNVPKYKMGDLVISMLAPDSVLKIVAGFEMEAPSPAVYETRYINGKVSHDFEDRLRKVTREERKRYEEQLEAQAGEAKASRKAAEKAVEAVKTLPAPIPTKRKVSAPKAAEKPAKEVKQVVSKKPAKVSEDKALKAAAEKLKADIVKSGKPGLKAVKPATKVTKRKRA